MAEELENKPVENNAQAEVTPEDVQNNKAFAILAYFWLLVLVPIFAAKESNLHVSTQIKVLYFASLKQHGG